MTRRLSTAALMIIGLPALLLTGCDDGPANVEPSDAVRLQDAQAATTGTETADLLHRAMAATRGATGARQIDVAGHVATDPCQPFTSERFKKLRAQGSVTAPAGDPVAVFSRVRDAWEARQWKVKTEHNDVDDRDDVVRFAITTKAGVTLQARATVLKGTASATPINIEVTTGCLELSSAAREAVERQPLQK